MMSAYYSLYIENGNIKKSSQYNPDILNHGLSIYEVVRIINKKILFFEEHYERLVNSAKMTSINLWLNKNKILEEMDTLMDINHVSDGNIEIIFHKTETNQNIFICMFIKPRYPTQEMIQHGVKSELHYAERFNPNAKIINLPLRVKTIKHIDDQDLYEVVFVDRNGYVTEGSRSNIFFIKGNHVYTSPVSEVLPGITRLKVCEMCQDHNIPLHEIPIKSDCIGDYDAAFFTGTSPNVLPIANIGEIQFNPQQHLLKKMVKLFDEFIYKYLTK